MNTPLAVNLDGLFSAIDSKDTERFLSFLTEHCVFRFGSSPPVLGHAAIGVAVAAFFSSISASAHTLHNTLASNSTLVCEGVVSYRRHDGSEISLPFTDVFEVDNGLISHYKIYMDIHPLYAV